MPSIINSTNRSKHLTSAWIDDNLIVLRSDNIVFGKMAIEMVVSDVDNVRTLGDLATDLYLYSSWLADGKTFFYGQFILMSRLKLYFNRFY